VNRKSHVDTKLGESFCDLPYLGICKYTVTLLMNFCVGRNYYIAVTWNGVHIWWWSGSIYNN